MSDNPLLEIEFEIPFDRIRPEHVEPAVEALLAESAAAVEAVAADADAPTYDNTLAALERATETLEYAMTIVGHLESVATQPALRAAYQAVQPKVAGFYSSIPLNTALWSRLRTFAATPAAAALTGVHARHLRKSIDEFKRHGAELDDAGKARLSEIDVELATITTTFGQHLLDATHEFELVIGLEDENKLAGLPDSAIAAAAERAQEKEQAGWRFTLDAPSYFPVMMYLEDDGIRERMWRAYNTRATSPDRDNRPLVARIIELRREKAVLLGYADFSDLVLEDRMAGSGARAHEFVGDLQTRTRDAFEQENAALRAYAGVESLQPWQVGVFSEKQRKEQFDFDDEALRPYFPIEGVINGMFQVVSRLYGIKIRPHDLPAWHETVRCYAVDDADGAFLGAFYADLFPRESKRGGAWMNGLITGHPPERPHLGLICGNLNPPVGDQPALLTHSDVETLFHEFGHLMHHLLSRVEVRSMAGSNVAWDFVELPSQIMENWCWERGALDLFARHHETGEPIPDDLFDRMHAARNYRAANAMMRQLGFAAVDLALHRAYDPARDGELLPYANAVLQAHAPAPLPADYAMLVGFNHLFGSPVAYAAGYYSYKWAEVLDADAFTRFAKAGVFDPEVGRAFREQILARGDAEDPLELYRSFMGRDPSLDALLRRSGLAA